MSRSSLGTVVAAALLLVAHAWGAPEWSEPTQVSAGDRAGQSLR